MGRDAMSIVDGELKVYGVDGVRIAVAAAFTKVLGRSVQMQIVPRDSWERLFKSQGMKNPLPRMQMLNGFNEGWIEFESGEAGSRKGGVSLESVLQGLIQESSVH